MISRLYKKTALGLYVFEVSIASTLKGSIITTKYGLYGKSATTHYKSGDVKATNAIIAKKRKEGYKLPSDIGLDNNDYNIAEVESKLPEYLTDESGFVKPMKCKPFVADYFDYESNVVGQPKINGNRVTVSRGMSGEGLFAIDGIVFRTHEGIKIEVDHLVRAFTNVFSRCPRNVVFDGEMYVRGEAVTSISGACKNPRNAIHKRLQFHCFDLAIPDVDQSTRLRMKDHIFRSAMTPAVYNQILPIEHSMGTLDKYSIINVCGQPIYNDEDAAGYRDSCLEAGYEGCVIRNGNAEYRFGSRPMTMMKLKKFKIGQFKVIDIIPFGFDIAQKNNVGQGCKFVLQNDSTSMLFESNPVGTVEEKLAMVKNKADYIGKMVTVKYYERTVTNLPFHTNVIFD